MRNTFANQMVALAQEINSVCLLSGDIGNRMFDEYKRVAPERFFNCGIAEASMMSVAAGMALAGLRPVLYTITPFITLRCLEQIRIGAGYHELPLVIVGTGSGLSYSELGATHHSLEDIAITRCIPNLQVCAPADSIELKEQLRDAVTSSKATYIRIGKKGEPNLLDSCRGNCGIGKANLIKDGEHHLILGIGPILGEAIKAQESLRTEGIKAAVASMGSVKPLDAEFLRSMISRGFKSWISLEEHYKSGGLGTTLLEWIDENDYMEQVRLNRVGVEDHFLHQLGPQEYMRKNEGLDSLAIERLVKSL